MAKDDSITRAYVITKSDDATVRSVAQRYRCSNSAALRIIIRAFENRGTLVDTGAEDVTDGVRRG